MMNYQDYLKQPLSRAANALRILSAETVQAANSGHPGMPMGMADVATVLFGEFIKTSANTPRWFDRDRFILSAGHGSSLLYSLGYLLGYKDLPLEELKNFRSLGSKTPGHPELGCCDIVDATTGPLGQGIANAVGMAIAERKLANNLGDNLVNHFTYVMAGDGCLMEGISHEAIELAAHLNLSKIILLWDDNGISIDGELALSSSADIIARFNACGWHTQKVDGHNHQQISTAIEAAKHHNLPSIIACKTSIGFGANEVMGTAKAHGAPLGDAQLKQLKANLNWDEESFEVDEPTLNWWRNAGSKSENKLSEWSNQTIEKQPGGAMPSNVNRGDFTLNNDISAALETMKSQALESQPKKSTRQCSGDILDTIMPLADNIIGGSADLSGSNNTKPKASSIINKDNFAGSYIHYGIREHAMGAVMNGITMHGGLRAYGGTFLVFSDYMRTPIRLSALSELPVVYVLTHDSIGVGEDGPTHQPIEHVASLRAIPNLNVIRPADMVETIEAWEISLQSNNTPSAIILTRQALPALRDNVSQSGSTSGNLVANGGYIIYGAANSPRDITLIASGSEVNIAVDAAKELEKSGKSAVVVSMPCIELFEAQTSEYKQQVLGSAPRIAIEAGVEQGWHKYVGDNGAIICMDHFGASAPGGVLFKHFGFTTEKIISTANSLIK